MFSKFLWKYFVRKLARSQGLMDPLMLLGRIGRFGQPSEIFAPLELLRATSILHIRGLLNAQAIQHNLDWIWPYWVDQQFDPRSSSFIPRAFSLTHINLTHRNWTAVGLPNEEETPLVDPRGLVTPFWDSWSIDTWIINKSGANLIPSKLKKIDQKVNFSENFRVITTSRHEELEIITTVEMNRINQIPVCQIFVEAKGGKDCQLVISLRPYNTEGVSLIESIAVNKNELGLLVNKTHEINFNIKPQKYVLSNYRHGDVYAHLDKTEITQEITCSAEMASAAAVFPIIPGKSTQVIVDIPLKKKSPELLNNIQPREEWADTLKNSPTVLIPDKRFQYLFDVGLRTLLIHTSKDVYAGPFTYKRFWFRDAIFITYALLCCGFHSRAERIIDHFNRRQKTNGLFESQEGEWDSNGQVLWIIEKFCKMTGKPPKPEWERMIKNGGNWIVKKRLPDNISNELHAGLMPSGFSAEHFGPNDYYYWDDFWSIAGLNAAAYLSQQFNDKTSANTFLDEAKKMNLCVENSISQVASRLKSSAMPSSPYRRLDTASIGSLVAGYPLNLWGEKDPRLIATVEYLFKNCLIHDGFFHDMSHSGINPYLTLHMAEVFLRAGDSRFVRLMNGIANIASSTGQWPEAVHPHTKGGCMGDGQHIWASAEWLMMIRNCFVREEEQGNRLILCSGLPFSWFKEAVNISFGPVWTIYGRISLNIFSNKNKLHINWNPNWHTEAPKVEVHFFLQDITHINNNKNSVIIDLNNLPS